MNLHKFNKRHFRIDAGDSTFVVLHHTKDDCQWRAVACSREKVVYLSNVHWVNNHGLEQGKRKDS